MKSQSDSSVLNFFFANEESATKLKADLQCVNRVGNTNGQLSPCTVIQPTVW